MLLGRKARTNLDTVLKTRDTTFLTKVHILKVTVFQVVMYRCELDHSLEGLTLKLKLQYFGHLVGRVDSLEKTLVLGGIGDRRRMG